MRKLPVLSVDFALAALPLAFALAVVPAVRAETAPPPVLRIASTAHAEGGKLSFLNNPVVARVIEEGTLEKELARKGVKLQWFPVMGDTGSITNEAFASRKIDFANYGDFPSITLNAAGFRTQVIVPIGRGTDMALLVPPGSAAKSIQDLKGKRISVHRRRPWDLGLQKLLQANGLSEKDFRIINLNPAAGAAALATGKVDAHFAIQAHLLEDKGVGKIIWTTEGKPLHFKMRAELWGATDFTRAHPELTQVVATAYVRAAHWVSQDQNRETVIQYLTRNGTPESAVRKNHADPSLSWQDRWSVLPDQVVLEHYREVVAFATERKLINRPLRAEDLVEKKFVEAALGELKLGDHWKAWQVETRASR